MGKLKDYYRLFDMFSGKLTDEQKKILEGLEDQLIAEEILPAISESVAPVLGALRRPLTLVVDYDPEGGIVVKTTRGEVVVKENTAKKYEIPSTKKTVIVAEVAGTKDTTKPLIKRAPKTGLCIYLPDGSFIQEECAKDTLIIAIKSIGAERVASLGLQLDKVDFVSKTKYAIKDIAQHPVDCGYYVNTHSNTKSKQRYLKKISKALNLNWKIEIIK